MKNILLATAATLAMTATAATAADFGIATEYAIEAEDFTTTFAVGQAVSSVYLSAEAEVVDTTFTGVDLGMTYGLTADLSVYGVVEVDSDFEYEEAVVGIAFNF